MGCVNNMWNNNIPNIKVLQPPASFQQFNAFEVLTPQKLDIKSNLLVDLSPDEDNSEDRNIETELNGSLIDTITKKNYDLIDVFQNIYVTPQHVSANIDKQQSNEDYLIDLGNIDNMTQPGDKLKVCNPHKAKITGEFYQAENLVASNINVFHDVCRCKESYHEGNSILSTSENSHDVFVQSEKFRKEIIEPVLDEVDEDFIDEVLLRHPPKLNTEKRSHLTNSDYNYNTKKSISISSKPIVNGLLQDLSTPFNIINDDIILCHDLKTDKNIFKPIATGSSLNNNHKTQNDIPFDYFPVRSKVEDIKLRSDKSIYCSNGYNILQVPSSSRSPSNSSMSPKFMIETVQRNEKLYLKRRITKKDHEKLTFTKGADIHEKNIVLPQIMQRLARRKIGLDERKNIKRKLILDRSATSFHPLTNLDSIVIMSDCNQERLKAWNVGTKFEDFVKRGNYNSN